MSQMLRVVPILMPVCYGETIEKSSKEGLEQMFVRVLDYRTGCYMVEDGIVNKL